MLPDGTTTFTISLTGKNSSTEVRADNEPYSLTVPVEVEPQLSVSQTLSVDTYSWTQFTNSVGQKIAEIKAEGTPITSFTVNMTPCTMPSGITRLRYVRRYYTFSSNAVNPEFYVRLFFTEDELQPYVLSPPALDVWQQVPPSGTWKDRGQDDPAIDIPVYCVGTTTYQTNISGVWAMATIWPKESGIVVTEAGYYENTKSVVLKWITSIKPKDGGFTLEHISGGLDINSSSEKIPISYRPDGRYEYITKPTEDGLYRYRIRAVNDEGMSAESEEIAISVNTNEIWAQNYPDPFNPTTTIVYHLPAPHHVNIKVFDVNWREIAELYSDKQTAGTHEVCFEGSNLPSGMYFYQLNVEGFVLTHNMVLLK